METLQDYIITNDAYSLGRELYTFEELEMAFVSLDFHESTARGLGQHAKTEHEVKCVRNERGRIVAITAEDYNNYTQVY